jgi:hypothetical protein
MIHVVIVIGSQKDFAIHSVPVVPDVIPRRFRQFCELRRRVDPVEAIDETPNLCAFANNFTRKNTKTVDGAFIKVSFNKKHGSYRGWLSACRQFERQTGVKCFKPARRLNLSRRLAFGL